MHDSNDDSAKIYDIYHQFVISIMYIMIWIVEFDLHYRSNLNDIL